MSVMRYSLLGLLLALTACDLPDFSGYGAPRLLAGEATDTSVMLHARLTAADTLDASGDLPGAAGWARFEYSLDPAMDKLVRYTPWQQATAEGDYIVQATLTALYPGRPYYYRLRYGPDTLRALPTGAQEIRTLDPAQSRPIRLVMVTGSHYDRFHLGGAFGMGRDTSQGKSGYTGPDAHLGFPAYEAIRLARPDYFIGNGDNVYYDHPEFDQAVDSAGMRRKWHRLFAQPRLRGLLRGVGTYWLKDDHDYRYDDADTTGERGPGAALGKALFPEQVPFPDPPYRTLRMSPDLQVWFVEGRDYRSPNATPDGPDKTLWGAEQLNWLKESLLASDATFKLLISPTPMIGPDDKRKTDNHTNPGGFRHEGDAFFAWLDENGFQDKGFYILCGDRHWQYHSIHPTGIEEFSCGALVDQNSRVGRKPGDPGSTDPAGLIRQPFTSPKAGGGFLLVELDPGPDAPTLSLRLMDPYGETRYAVEKQRVN